MIFGYGALSSGPLTILVKLYPWDQSGPSPGYIGKT